MSRIGQFLGAVEEEHASGQATEHSYRPALQALLNSLADGITALNEPKRTEVGAPDFNIYRTGNILVGNVEAKDLPIDIRHLKGRNKKQRDDYAGAQPNLVYTNCLDWDFYRDGKVVASISIAEFGTPIKRIPKNYQILEGLLLDFVAQRPQTITSPQRLAQMMAGKAILVKGIMGSALRLDEELTTELAMQYKAFRSHLLHNISPEEFADIYAETIAYGMFAARLHDKTLDDFSRAEALELLPKSNPFLRSLFVYIAGPDLDDRIRWVIDDLASLLQAADVAKLMEGFGSFTGKEDPFIHFYETFLSAYNPKKRKARGVWYTPEPVVNFIVRAVDEVLRTEFGLADGLADTSKITVDWDTGQNNKKGKPVTIRKDVHRVQILDPATGTGTFLAEVIKQIAPRVKGVAEGMWSQYVESDLIPRLHGFELLMASYSMCHMKLEMILTEMGYNPTGTPPRLGVYLTNSLEKGERDTRDLFMAQWLTREAREANKIKRQAPIMCVIGNPPYSGESANKGDWIMGLMEAYKKEPGGIEKLKERNPKWINDDYVKFIRFSEHLIERNGEGVLGFITNHGYLDNPTFRGMRWHLLRTFDRLYVLDLHGNSKKKEVTPEGKPDKNVFDIQQGVAVIIGVKRRSAKRREVLAEVFHAEFWGDRSEKYQNLSASGLTDDIWQLLDCRAPQYPLLPRDYSLEKAYRAGFGLHKFMPINSVGIVTARDALTIDIDKQRLWDRVQDFAQLDPEAAREKYSLGKDVRDWRVEWAQADVNGSLSFDKVTRVAYRPFDLSWTFYTGNSRGFMCYPRKDVMQHYVQYQNLGLLAPGGVKDRVFHHAFVTSTISEAIFLSGTTASNAKNFPLYLHPTQQDIHQLRRVNFEPKLLERLQGLAVKPGHPIPDELTVFDYIYGVLYCPVFRSTYAEFLKIDYPHIPWPSSTEEFWDVSDKGGQLRRLHLMEEKAIGLTPYPFKGEGDAVVDALRFEDGKVWINKAQYFDDVPDVSWGFHIGGYQPAQKWLKDRKGRTLSFEDVKHYQRIIKILSETDRIMRTITMELDTEPAVADEAPSIPTKPG
jgi:hypothetical protein